MVSRYNDNAKHLALDIHGITRYNVNNALYSIWLFVGALLPYTIAITLKWPVLSV
jgi:hypothetical protein